MDRYNRYTCRGASHNTYIRLATICSSHTFTAHKQTSNTGYTLIHSFYRQVVVDVSAESVEDVVNERFGSDSHTTLPSVSFRMNLYWKAVFGGSATATIHVG